MLKRFRDGFLNLAFPQPCHVCGGQVQGHDDGVACRRCWDETRLFDPETPLCSKCGNLMLGGADPLRNCKECLSHQFDRAYALGVYEKALAASVLNLKQFPNIPRRLVDTLKVGSRAWPLLEVEVLLPVPLSRRRRVERGFNQAEVIAALLSRMIARPVDVDTLVRRIHTPVHRAGMDRKAREATVENAFEVRRPKLVEGRRVLLVDDVFTSGSTVSNCAKLLKKNGAASVQVFTLARAVMSR